MRKTARRMGTPYRLARLVATRLQGVRGVDRLLRILHHPDKRANWYIDDVFDTVFDGPRFRLSSRWFTEWTTIFYGTQDKRIHRWIKDNVKKEWVCFDVGANFGFFTCVLAQLCHQVHSFEPVPFLYERLVSNCLLNDQVNVVPRRLALSNTTGEVDFHVAAQDAPNQGTGGLIFDAGGAILKAEAITLDEYVSEMALTRIDFIKIDVEGAESLVLSGGRKTLARFKPAIIFENDNRPEDVTGLQLTKECISLLRFHGYMIRTLDGVVVTEVPPNSEHPDLVAEMP